MSIHTMPDIVSYLEDAAIEFSKARQELKRAKATLDIRATKLKETLRRYFDEVTDGSRTEL